MVKRQNFVDLFLDNYQSDEYIVTHLYGALYNLNPNASYDELEDVFNKSALDLSCTFDQRAHSAEKQADSGRKMSSGEVYIALLKGYCASVVLMMPKTFQNGGLGVTPIFIITSAVLSSICIGKLVDAGLATNLYSYSLVMEKALGKKGRLFLDIMVALTQFSFTLTGAAFISNTFKMTIDTLWGIETNIWVYGAIIIAVFIPFSWVRNIGKFSFTFMLGNLLVLMAVLFVSVYCCMLINRDGIGEDIKFINPDGYQSAIGMAIFSYEGIGIVMPIMHQSESPATFKREFIKAMVTLTVIYVIFGALGYIAWGSGEIEPFSTDMLPASNIAVILMKFFFSFNLIFTYPITIFPAN